MSRAKTKPEARFKIQASRLDRAIAIHPAGEIRWRSSISPRPTLLAIAAEPSGRLVPARRGSTESGDSLPSPLTFDSEQRRTKVRRSVWPIKRAFSRCWNKHYMRCVCAWTIATCRRDREERRNRVWSTTHPMVGCRRSCRGRGRCNLVRLSHPNIQGRLSRAVGFDTDEWRCPRSEKLEFTLWLVARNIRWDKSAFGADTPLRTS
jgi:hypothetical protein